MAEGVSGPPVIEWTGPSDLMGDATITIGPVTRNGISQMYTRTLGFATLRTSHSGQYTCNAASVGNATTEQNVTLFVQSKLSWEQSLSYGVVLVWLHIIKFSFSKKANKEQ